MALPPSDRLRTVLRRLLDDPVLELTEPPVRVGRGVQAEVWALRLVAAAPARRVPLVLRVFHMAGQEEQARYEAAWQNALADQGFAVPRVIAVGGDGDGLGGAFMLMERLAGRPLMELVAPLMGIAAATALLGVGWVGGLGFALYLGAAVRPALRLHSLPAERVHDALVLAGVPRERALLAGWPPLLEERAAQQGLHGLGPAIAWLRDHLSQDGERVPCHGDYHPGNLMVTWRRLSGVIDWTGATIAPPEFDLAWTLIQPCLTVQLPLSLPRRARLVLDEAMRPLIFLGTAPVRWVYRALRGLDRERLRVAGALAAVRALVLLAEIRLENPWHNPRTMRLLCRRFERVTGVPIELPAHVIRGEPDAGA